MTVRSLRSRVTIWYVGLLAAALIVFGVLLYLALQHYLEASLENSLRADAKTIAAKFVADVETKGTAWLVDELADSYPPESIDHYVRVSRLSPGQENPILFQTAAIRDLSGNVPAIASNYAQGPHFRFVSAARDPKVVIYSLPFNSSSGTQYLIEAGVSNRPVEQLLRSFLKILLILTPLILLVAAIGGYLMMTQPLKPVVLLTEQAERIGTGQLGERLPVIPTGDELERLSHSLNRMISRLEDALDHNRRFSADVSHELRTPLTILRGELEHVIQLRNIRPEIVDSVGSALEEIERLAKIVESLLAISHLDTGGAGIEFAAFDLQAMAKATADQMRLLADEKHISLRTDAAETVLAMGDQARIKQVLVNLLDNAIKYTGEGGHIVIEVAAQGLEAVLTVKDDGIGIPQEALPYVFQRFYRANKDRSRGISGAGLGLSIVEAICRAHGGSVSITSTERRGTAVEVRLPLAGAQAGSPPTRSQLAVLR
jgi:heavy metal sensor kinase